VSSSSSSPGSSSGSSDLSSSVSESFSVNCAELLEMSSEFSEISLILSVRLQDCNLLGPRVPAPFRSVVSNPSV